MLSCAASDQAGGCPACRLPTCSKPACCARPHFAVTGSQVSDCRLVAADEGGGVQGKPRQAKASRGKQSPRQAPAKTSAAAAALPAAGVCACSSIIPPLPRIGFLSPLPPLWIPQLVSSLLPPLSCLASPSLPHLVASSLARLFSFGAKSRATSLPSHTTLLYPVSSAHTCRTPCPLLPAIFKGSMRRVWARLQTQHRLASPPRFRGCALPTSSPSRHTPPGGASHLYASSTS